MSTTGYQYRLETTVTERELRRVLKLLRDSQGFTDQTWVGIVCYLIATVVLLGIWAVSSAHEWGFLVAALCLLAWTAHAVITTRLRFIAWRFIRRDGGAVLESLGCVVMTDQELVLRGLTSWAAGAESHLPWSTVKVAVRERDDSMIVVIFGPRGTKDVRGLKVLLPRALGEVSPDASWADLVETMEQQAVTSGFPITTHRRNWDIWH